jgi:hypothetical protein
MNQTDTLGGELPSIKFYKPLKTPEDHLKNTEKCAVN